MHPGAAPQDKSGIRQRAAKKQIEIQNIYDENGRTCFDLKWTKEALENILDNAVKYSPCGSETILSVTEYEMYAAVSVKDFGRGIQEENVPKIFGRFYRAEEVQQEEGVGNLEKGKWIYESEVSARGRFGIYYLFPTVLTDTAFTLKYPFDIMKVSNERCTNL